MIEYLHPESVVDATLRAAVLFWGTSISLILAYGFFNLHLHPLRHYPGPRLWCAFRISWIYSVLTGRFSYDVLELHKKYGPVVRVAPNELSYTDSAAVKPIYGHHNASEGFSEFAKDKKEYLRPPNGVFSMLGANSADHSRFRRLMSHSFSDRGMREMQSRIQDCVGLFIKNLSEQSRKDYQDLVQWYNWATFDMIGDLAFGESFHCLETKTTDPWIISIFRNVKAIPFIGALKRYNLEFLIPLITPKYLLEARKKNMERSAAKIETRIKGGDDRGDFWDNVIAKSDFEKGTGMTTQEMVANAGLLVLGGSETTATLLSGATYLLCKNPEVMKKLMDEVREAFNHEYEIDLISVNKLDYMFAVLDEAMRIYPPVPNQGNRVVPKGGAMVAGKWVPGGTSLQVSQYASNHSPANFFKPECFIPERWLSSPPVEFANDDRAARQPFSHGPRNCIGRNLAYAEMRLILAKICWNFDLELDDSRCGDWIKEQKIFGLWEKGPLWVKLTPIER